MALEAGQQLEDIKLENLAVGVMNHHGLKRESIASIYTTATSSTSNTNHNTLTTNDEIDYTTTLNSRRSSSFYQENPLYTTTVNTTTSEDTPSERVKVRQNLLRTTGNTIHPLEGTTSSILMNSTNSNSDVNAHPTLRNRRTGVISPNMIVNDTLIEEDQLLLQSERVDDGTSKDENDNVDDNDDDGIYRNPSNSSRVRSSSHESIPLNDSRDDD